MDPSRQGVNPVPAKSTVISRDPHELLMKTYPEIQKPKAVTAYVLG